MPRWRRPSSWRALPVALPVEPLNRFLSGNRITLLRSGAEYFPALEHAIDGAEREVWLEAYLFADDRAGRLVANALARAAQRGVKVRLLVDGWGRSIT